LTNLGNFRQDSCGFSPSNSPDVINVGAIQEAEDTDSPGRRGRFSITYMSCKIITTKVAYIWHGLKNITVQS